jgi:hypothetical protein
LIKDYLAAAGKFNVTKREAYESVITLYLELSFVTFNRLFNSFVQKHCLNPLEIRGNDEVGLAVLPDCDSGAHRFDFAAVVGGMTPQPE